MQIELSKFIENILIQVAEGTRSANEKLKNAKNGSYDIFCLRENNGDSSKIPGIKFDVAITTASQQNDKAGLFVLLANKGGTASTEKSLGNEMVNRIQFEIGIESKWR